MNLTELHKKYGTQNKCIAYLEKLRWGKKYLPFYLAEFSYKYNNRHLQKNSFEKLLVNTLNDEKCMLNYKPIGDTKQIAYGKRKTKKCLS